MTRRDTTDLVHNLPPDVTVIHRITDVHQAPADRHRLRMATEPALIPERVMVCMSSNALAPRVIHTGARIADRLGAQWYAVYVETPLERPDRIATNDSNALRQNMSLAESLGATLV
jgi:K+-sensing histidine kinase KdpD